MKYKLYKEALGHIKCLVLLSFPVNVSPSNIFVYIHWEFHNSHDIFMSLDFILVIILYKCPMFDTRSPFLSLFQFHNFEAYDMYIVFASI